jgi:hypothetical protein
MTVISDLNKARDLNIIKAKEIQVRVEKLFYELNVAKAQGNSMLAKKVQAEIDINGQMLIALTEEMNKITSQLLAETKVFTARVEERNETIKSLKTAIGIIGGIGIISFFAVFGGFEYGFVVFFGALIICAPLGFYMSRLGLNNIDDLHRASGKDESLVSALRNKLEAEIKLSSSISDMESSANKLKNATTYEDKVKHEAEYKKAQANLERSKLNLNDASQLVSASQPIASPVDELRFMPELYASSAKIEEDSFPDKDLSNDAYKIYLVKKYEIEKNDVLSKFICNDKLFATVDEALEFAHSLEILQGGETAVGSTDDALGAHETPGPSSSIELDNEEERIKNSLTPDQWEEAKAASKTSGLTLSEWRLATDKLMSELGIGYKNSKYCLGNYQYDYLNDAINSAKKNKTVNLTTASDETSTKPARNNKAIIAIFLGVLVVAAIVIFNKLENNKTAATGKVQSNSKSSVESSNLNEITELVQRLDIMNKNADSINKDLESMGNRYDQWMQANASSYLTKTPLRAENISPNQLSDNSIATPQQRNEIQNIITYRKNDLTTTYELIKRYQPLPPSIAANYTITQKVRERFIADIQLLANGSITFGRFNELRLQNTKNSNLAYSKIQKVADNALETSESNTNLFKSGSITSSELVKRKSQNMKADEKTLEDIVRNFRFE